MAKGTRSVTSSTWRWIAEGGAQGKHFGPKYLKGVLRIGGEYCALGLGGPDACALQQKDGELLVDVHSAEVTINGTRCGVGDTDIPLRALSRIEVQTPHHMAMVVWPDLPCSLPLMEASGDEVRPAMMGLETLGAFLVGRTPSRCSEVELDLLLQMIQTHMGGDKSQCGLVSVAHRATLATRIGQRPMRWRGALTAKPAYSTTLVSAAARCGQPIVTTVVPELRRERSGVPDRTGSINKETVLAMAWPVALGATEQVVLYMDTTMEVMDLAHHPATVKLVSLACRLLDPERFAESRQPSPAGDLDAILQEHGLFLGGHSKACTELRNFLDYIALSPYRSTIPTFFITGETGTGKTALARVLNDLCRPEGAFRECRLAGRAGDGALQSELFGHRKGAFTGAMEDHAGLFEQASGGTLLVNDIDGADLGDQKKMLDVLQDRTILRVGGGAPIKVDVCVVATTNADLLAAVGSGKFRLDLYYRVSIYVIHLPPLRERMDQVEAIAQRIAGKLIEEVRQRCGTAPVVDSKAFAPLRGYDWPGNIRQLANVLDPAVRLAQGGVVTEASVLKWLEEERARNVASPAVESNSLLDAVNAHFPSLERALSTIKLGEQYRVHALTMLETLAKEEHAGVTDIYQVFQKQTKSEPAGPDGRAEEHTLVMIDGTTTIAGSTFHRSLLRPLGGQKGLLDAAARVRERRKRAAMPGTGQRGP